MGHAVELQARQLGARPHVTCMAVYAFDTDHKPSHAIMWDLVDQFSNCLTTELFVVKELDKQDINYPVFRENL